MTAVRNFVLIVLGLAAVVLYFSVFTVHETERALKFRLGEVIRAEYEPGLHFKMPFITNVRKFDARVQTLDAEPDRYLTGELKNLIVDAFVKWRVSETRQFYTTVQGNVTEANRRLDVRVKDMLRSEFGRRDVQDVISDDRALIMDILREGLNDYAQTIGVEVVDVRLKRVDLPPAVSESVFARMRADRERVARDIRARGDEVAAGVRADADRQRTETLAEARRDSEELRGQGDAEATQIYASAFGRDQEFFTFTRSLNSYQRAFQSEEDIMVLTPDSEFFRYFRDSLGRGDD